MGVGQFPGSALQKRCRWCAGRSRAAAFSLKLCCLHAVIIAEFIPVDCSGVILLGAAC